jgi:hypothetical protein
MAGQPGFDLGMFVGGVVFNDSMDRFALWHSRLDGIAKLTVTGAWICLMSDIGRAGT